jgi:peptidoglycan/xylan/chitin deacetylase (PgdA/CDA1 family)
MSNLKHPKQAIKRGLQYIAASFGPHARSFREPKLLILMYHRILPKGDARLLFEEPGMYTSPQTFKKNLETLSQSFDFMTLSDWVERKSLGKPLPPKTCTITFDDGWADNFEFAYPILEELSIPATIFLVSDMIGTTETFWPERLAHIMTTIAINKTQFWSSSSLDWLRPDPIKFRFSDAPPSPDEISLFIAKAKQFTDQEIQSRLKMIETELGLEKTLQTPTLLNWEQVNEMTESGLIEVGSHTCRHTRLDTRIPQQTLLYEVVNSKREIETKTGKPVKTFCFPNGDYNARALDLVRKNYLGAVTTESGWNTRNTSDYSLRRIGIHEDIAQDKTSFLARISGWF